MENFRKLRNILETVRREAQAPKKRSISGEDAFVTPVPLRSSRGFGDTRFRSSGGHLEDSCSEGGGSLLVTELGSLTVTGLTGEEVAAEGRAVNRFRSLGARSR